MSNFYIFSETVYFSLGALQRPSSSGGPGGTSERSFKRRAWEKNASVVPYGKVQIFEIHVFWPPCSMFDTNFNQQSTRSAGPVRNELQSTRSAGPPPFTYTTWSSLVQVPDKQHMKIPLSTLSAVGSFVAVAILFMWGNVRPTVATGAAAARAWSTSPTANSIWIISPRAVFLAGSEDNDE